MDFDKGVDGFLVGMRGDLSKYQLWWRRKGNQLTACALFWQKSSSSIFYLQRLDSLRIHRGRHYLKKLGYSTLGKTRKQLSFPSRWRQIENEW